MTDLLASLEASAFSTWLRESPSVWAYPTVLTLHTLGLGVLVGANWMVDLRVLGIGRAIPLGILSRAFPIMWAGFSVSAISGALLFVADPAKATTTIFMWKLAIIAVGVAFVLLLKRRVYGRGVEMDRASFGVKTIAAVSLMIWVAAIATGRWMAYVV
jgi:Family of unknown function (DUF6644)